jgi:hypothetical protein
MRSEGSLHLIGAERPHCSRGADPNHTSGRLPRSCLHCAVGWRHEACARLLLDRQADVTARDKDGEIPLHLACRCENTSEESSERNGNTLGWSLLALLRNVMLMCACSCAGMGRSLWLAFS